MRRLLASARGAVFRFRDDSLFRNSLFIMGVTVSTSAFGFVYWVVAARVYRTADVGVAAALISALTIAAAVANVGIHSAFVERLPGQSSGKDWSLTVNAGLLGGLASGTVVGAVCLVLLPLASSDFDQLIQRPDYAIVFVAAVVLTTLANLLDYACVAERAAGRMLTRNLAFAILKVPVLVVPAFVAAEAFGIFSSWVIGLLITVLFGVLLLRSLRRAWKPVVKGSIERLRSMLSSLAGHHLVNVGNLAPASLLPVLVTVQVSATSTAYFFAAWRISSIFFMVSPSVATSLFAEGSHRSADLGYKARASARLIAILLLPLLALCLATSKLLLGAFGAEYAEEGLVLLFILAFAAIPDAFTNVYVSVLRVQSRLGTAAVLTTGMAIGSLVLAWFLLPELGIAGAGVGWLIAQVCGAGIVLVCTRARWLRHGPADEAETGAEPAARPAAGVDVPA